MPQSASLNDRSTNLLSRVDWWVSLGTLPLLFSLVSGSLALQAMRWLGTNSEEIFRGDLLPPLCFPEPTQHNIIEELPD